MNSALLKSQMALFKDTQQDLADFLGISLSNLNAKINGKGSDFRQNEIKAIKERYALSAADVDKIFFAA